MSFKSSPCVVEYTTMRKGHLGDASWHAGIIPSAPLKSYHVLSNSVSGGENPRWRQQIKKCQNATTSLAGYKFTWDSLPLNAVASVNVYGNPNQEPGHTWIYMYGSHYVPRPDELSGPPGSLSDKVKSQASTNLYKSLDRKTTLLNGGTILGEGRETLRMLKSPAQALRAKVSSWTRGAEKVARRERQRSKRSSAVADSYLEAAFGWSPLISDIGDATDYLEKRKVQLERKLTYVSGKHSDSTSSAAVQSFGTTAWKAHWTVVTTWKSSTKYRGALAIETSVHNIPTVRALGLSWQNVLPTAWELIPWSFMIDYFTNVGDLITALSYRNVRFAWGYQTSEHLTVAKSTVVVVKLDPGVNYHFFSQNGAGGRTESTRRFVSRDPISTVPFPSFYLEVPGAGSNKWLNIAALGIAKTGLSRLIL